MKIVIAMMASAVVCAGAAHATETQSIQKNAEGVTWQAGVDGVKIDFDNAQHVRRIYSKVAQAVTIADRRGHVMRGMRSRHGLVTDAGDDPGFLFVRIEARLQNNHASQNTGRHRSGEFAQALDEASLVGGGEAIAVRAARHEAGKRTLPSMREGLGVHSHDPLEASNGRNGALVGRQGVRLAAFGAFHDLHAE